MSNPDPAAPAPADRLVILAADDDAICVDDLCLPPDARREMGAKTEGVPAPALEPEPEA